MDESDLTTEILIDQWADQDAHAGRGVHGLSDDTLTLLVDAVLDDVCDQWDVAGQLFGVSSADHALRSHPDLWGPDAHAAAGNGVSVERILTVDRPLIDLLVGTHLPSHYGAAMLIQEAWMSVTGGLTDTLDGDAPVTDADGRVECRIVTVVDRSGRVITAIDVRGGGRQVTVTRPATSHQATSHQATSHQATSHQAVSADDVTLGGRLLDVVCCYVGVPGVVFTTHPWVQLLAAWAQRVMTSWDQLAAAVPVEDLAMNMMRVRPDVLGAVSVLIAAGRDVTALHDSLSADPHVMMGELADLVEHTGAWDGGWPVIGAVVRAIDRPFGLAIPSPEWWDPQSLLTQVGVGSDDTAAVIIDTLLTDGRMPRWFTDAVAATYGRASAIEVVPLGQ